MAQLKKNDHFFSQWQSSLFGFDFLLLIVFIFLRKLLYFDVFLNLNVVLFIRKITLNTVPLLLETRKMFEELHAARSLYHAHDLTSFIKSRNCVRSDWLV